MKSREFEKLIKKHLLPHLPGFKVKKNRLLLYPINYLLRAFLFESSQFDPNNFTIEVFVQPLYIPQDFISFNIGSRLGSMADDGHDWWDYTPKNEVLIMNEILSLIKKYGVPFLQRIQTPLDLVEEIKREFPENDYPDSYYIEIIAFSLILSEKFEAALQELNRLIYILKEFPELEEWQFERMKRAERLRDMLKENKKDEVIQLLKEWTVYTAKNLRLEEYLELE
ncbi:MAG: hypothetical protein D6732_28670 [Methanobacteriota archaeon]|nr:MAG: hypothetical protein D6732_28670 [Euryarchaeota archaeon]